MENSLGSKEQLQMIAGFLAKFGKFFNEAAQLCLQQLSEEDVAMYKHRMLINYGNKSKNMDNKRHNQQRIKKENETKDLSLQMIKDLKPKHPVSSFFFFYKERSQQIAKEQGEIIGSQLAKIIGNIWQTMSEAEKQPFQVKAKQSREKYEKQMVEYTSKYSKQIAMYKRHKKEQKQVKKRYLQALMKPRKVEAKLKEQEKQDDNSSQLSDSILSLSQDMSDSLGIKSKESQSSNQPIQYIKADYCASQPNRTGNQAAQNEIISNSNSKNNVQNAKKSSSFDEDIILAIADDSHTNIQDRSTFQNKISKPKGPVSSFFMFYQFQGKRIASQNGISLGPQAIKLASVEWNQIPEVHKEKYRILSEKTREKYKQEMSNLKKQYGDSVFDTKRAKKSRNWSKKTKRQNS